MLDMDNTEYIYVLGDGDKIREKVENYLLNHNLEVLATFSRSLTNAISEIANLAISTMNAQVIVAGGDDILLLVPHNKYQRGCHPDSCVTVSHNHCFYHSELLKIG
jgi:hypothetical protein